MTRRLLNCISTIAEFDRAEYDRLDIGVEIQDFTEPNLTAEEVADRVQQYKHAFKDFRQPKALHGPFLDLKPSSPDPQIKSISQTKYQKTLDIAAELGMDYVIFHSQINPHLNEPSLAQLNDRQSRDAWLEMTQQARAFQGIIVIENVFEKSPALLKSQIETIGQAQIKVNLDVGHCKLGEAALEAWIGALQDHIAYIHLHSNNGIHDQHVRAPRQEIEQLYLLLDRYQIHPVIALEYRIDDLANEVNRLALRAGC